MTLKRYSLIATLVVCVATAGFLAYRYRALWFSDGDKGPEAEHGRPLPKRDKTRTRLYFSDLDHRFLTAEVRTLALADSAAERARGIIDALIEGPEGPLTPTIPGGTKVLALYVTEDGTVYVDFNGAITENHPGGAVSELLTIFSLVNTLALNIPEVRAVKILIGGHEAKTLAGHIDIRFPMAPDVSMIQSPTLSSR